MPFLSFLFPIAIFKIYSQFKMANKSAGMFAMDQLPEGVAFGVLAICGLSILLNAICLPVSALNFAMIAQTALLHRNLKFLLLLQSFCVALFSVSEIFRTTPKLAHFDIFYLDSLTFTTMKITLILMIFIDWLGFGLLCERILATIKCRTYEADRRSHFAAICFILLCLVTFACYYSSVDFNEPSGVRMDPFFLCEIYSFLALSFICILIIICLLKYNKRLYTKMAFVRPNSRIQVDLSMKYQLSENIRTSRQLLPSGVFHFVDVFLTIAISLLSYYGILNKNATWSGVCHNSIFLLYALSNLGIQISVIIMHPMLNRKLRRMFNALKMAHLWKRRVMDSGGNENEAGGHFGGYPVPLNIFGDNLLCKNADIGEYFRMLDAFWNKPIPSGGRGRRKKNDSTICRSNATIA